MTEPTPRVLKHSARVGQYEIRGVLGCGDYGVTYKAYDRALERRAAIKEYFPTALAVREDDRFTLSKRSPDLAKVFGWGLQAFIREARTLAVLNEPSIVRVQQYLEANGTGYLAMNYEDGCTLSRVLEQWQRLNQQQLRALTVHMLRGLRGLHASGYLHRDISPASIMVRRSGPPVLIDFGTARRTLGHALSERNLQPDYAETAASQAFVPLEVASVDGAEMAAHGPWSDLYALGATVYSCALGEAPASVQGRIGAIEDGAVDPLTAGLDRLAGVVNGRLCEAIEWMMQLDADHRPRRAGEVLSLLTPSRNRRAAAMQAPPQTASTAGQATAHPLPLNGVDRGAAPFNAPAPPPEGDDGSAPGSSGHTGRAPLVLGAVVMHALHSQLAKLLGPIAPILIKRTLARCSSERELFDALAAELDVPEERDAFLDACSVASSASHDG